MLSTRTALLLVLRDGPGYGLDLVRRMAAATGGASAPAEGSTYPALRALQAAGFVRSWVVSPRPARGARARTYYELTPRGITSAAAERESLLRLAGGPAPSQDGDRMRRRLAGKRDQRGGAPSRRGRSREMRRGRSRFLGVARKVVQAIGSDDCVLAGGLAVMAHGFVRATRDVDVLTRVALPEARRRLEGAGLPVRQLRGDPLEGGFACLKGECDGLPFDVLPEIVPVHWEAAVDVDPGGGGALRVVPLLDLLALKLKAQGVKDPMDAAMLVLMHPETEARARELATAYGALERLEPWLRDPRARAQAREELAREARPEPARSGLSRGGPEKPHRRR